MISPNGIAHIQLTVRDVAASRPFYHRLLVETLATGGQQFHRNEAASQAAPQQTSSGFASLSHLLLNQEKGR